jgi:parallel beta-helix repeat protein
VLCAKYNISGDYILVNPQSLSGTISQNTLVAGTNIKVTDNLTVNTGVNLVFEDGAIVKFNSGKRITVNGTIIAKNVMFQKNGTSDWYGIVVTGTGNASYIKYCTIKESQYGILIGGEKYIKIQNNYISGSSDAISIYNNGNPEIDNCYIQGGTEADVLSSANAMGRVTNCELSGTASSGHKNMGNAATVLNYYSNGRNNIKGRYGIASVYVLGGYPGYDYGIDVIERSYGCNFYNASGHTLYARYNCWGSSMNNSGPIVLNPVYPTCPPNPIGPDWQLQKSSQDALNEAWWAYSDGEFSKAEDLTEQVFNENKKGDRAGEALFLQMKCAHHLSSLSDNQNKLVSILSDKEVSAMAKYEAIRWQMIFELERKNIPSAKTLALSIPDTSNMSREILLSLAIGLIEELRDFEEAEKILSLYVAKSPEAKFPGEESAEKIKNEILSFYKGLYNGSDSSPKESPESVVSIIPEKYELLSNYPNPFNPTTTIKYTIPKESDVQVTIYDIMGREVKTIVSSRQEAGYKEVVWNGTDNNNQKVSSGIYIYRLRATSTEDLKVFDKSAKLILLK